MRRLFPCKLGFINLEQVALVECREANDVTPRMLAFHMTSGQQVSWKWGDAEAGMLLTALDPDGFAGGWKALAARAFPARAPAPKPGKD